MYIALPMQALEDDVAAPDILAEACENCLDEECLADSTVKKLNSSGPPTHGSKLKWSLLFCSAAIWAAGIWAISANS